MDAGLKDYYESNLQLLKEYHPATWELLQTTKPEPLGNIVTSSSGKPNLSVLNEQGDSIVLHNEENPDDETNLFTKIIPDSHQGFVGIIGMGLGYGIPNILEEKPQVRNLAVFELQPGIFVQALRCMDFSDFLKDPRLILRIGDKIPIEAVLKPARDAIKLEDSRILNSPSIFKIKQDDYSKLAAEVYNYINLLNIEGTTTKVLGKQFAINRFQHISTIHHHRTIDQLRNIFPKKPAILVAGGPSLDKNVHLLKQVQEHAVIFAADTVFPTLLNHGVRPHFISSIDPNNVTFEKLADVVSEGSSTSLICLASVNLKIAKIFPAKQIFWAFTAKAPEIWINKLIGGKFETAGASTVAHLNLIAATVLGCDPIIFVGQDLAYPTGASHAKGAVLHGIAPGQNARGNIESKMTLGVDGKMVRTDRGFLSMKNHFETMIKNRPEKFINATEGGAHIEGTEVLALTDVIDTYCKENINSSQYLDDYYKTIKPPVTEKLVSEFLSLQKTIQTVFKKMKQADAITKTLLKELKKGKGKGRIIKAFNMLSQAQKKQAIKIDRVHNELDNTDKIWHLLEEITMEGLKESNRQKHEIESFKNDPMKYTDWLIKNLERLLAVNKARKEPCDLLYENLENYLSFREKEERYQGDKNKIELARLYVESGNYNLAKPILNELLKQIPDSGEIHFLCGCTHLQFNEISDAETHFQQAVLADPNFSDQIERYRQDIGDEFLSFVHHFKKYKNRDASVKYTLRKGLLLCPFHKDLRDELESILNRDLKQIKKFINQGKYIDASPLINEWKQLISDFKYLIACIPDPLLKDINFYYGKLQLSKKEYIEAIDSFKSALKHAPKDHDLFFLLIDTCFVAQDFVEGISILNQAIGVDIKFASYWETIGDQLAQNGQNEDAVAAYEKCFHYLPENIGLVKKIGDCYLNAELLEEAKAAYELFKQMLENENRPSSH